MKKEYKEGVDFVFEQNPELAKIGTEKDYSDYIKTIFPESKVKDIVYHGSNNKEIENFKVGERDHFRFGSGIYFSKNYKAAKSYADSKNGKTYFAILNIKNSKNINDNFWEQTYTPLEKFLKINKIKHIIKGILSPELRAKIKYKSSEILSTKDSSIVNNGEEIIVYNPTQIHMLNSEQDIEEFKKYMKSKNNSKDNSLEGKIISGLFILSFLAGVFLIPYNLTGNVVGNLNKSSSSFIGIILFLLGISGFFIYKKLRS